MKPWGFRSMTDLYIWRAGALLSREGHLAISGFPSAGRPLGGRLWLLLGGLEPAGSLLGLLAILIARAPKDHAAAVVGTNSSRRAFMAWAESRP